MVQFPPISLLLLRFTVDWSFLKVLFFSWIFSSCSGDSYICKGNPRWFCLSIGDIFPVKMKPSSHAAEEKAAASLVLLRDDSSSSSCDSTEPPLKMAKRTWCCDDTSCCLFLLISFFFLCVFLLSCTRFILFSLKNWYLEHMSDFLFSLHFDFRFRFLLRLSLFSSFFCFPTARFVPFLDLILHFLLCPCGLARFSRFIF